MKKIIITLALIILITGSVNATNVIVEIKGHQFSPSEQAFKDIYGGGAMYGGEISIGIWKGLQVWFGGSYFTKKGELTFTKEETKLSITPIGLGIKYAYPVAKMFDIYCGLGANYYSYKEENPIGNVSKGGLGAIVKVGGLLKIIKGLVVDLYFDYTYCKIKPADFNINIGGTEVGLGIGYEF